MDISIALIACVLFSVLFVPALDIITENNVILSEFS